MVTVNAGAVCQPKPGEVVSGDSVGIWQDGASTLLTVIDGLGSGQAAAEATQSALTCVQVNLDRSLSEIIVCCHRALQGTRGVVMALVRVEHCHDRLTFAGVGNIGFSAATTKPMRPISRNGVLGHRLPAPREFCFDCTPGDVVVLYSDGISSRFVLNGGVAALSWAPPRELSRRIVKRFGTGEDDVAVAALVMTGTTDRLSHRC